MIVFYAKRIRKVLNDIWEKFWPASVDPDLQKMIDNSYMMVLNGILTFITTTAIFVILVVVAPTIVANERMLPYPTVYPFDWTVSPVYEITFFLQSFCDLIVPVIVLGYDFLFFSLCFTVIAQYICLHHVISRLGSRDMKEVLVNIGFSRDDISLNQDDVAKLFIKTFVKQHEILIR